MTHCLRDILPTGQLAYYLDILSTRPNLRNDFDNSVLRKVGNWKQKAHIKCSSYIWQICLVYLNLLLFIWSNVVAVSIFLYLFVLPEVMNDDDDSIQWVT